VLHGAITYYFGPKVGGIRKGKMVLFFQQNGSGCVPEHPPFFSPVLGGFSPSQALLFEKWHILGEIAPPYKKHSRFFINGIVEN
jgi:hypothetical protein